MRKFELSCEHNGKVIHKTTRYSKSEEDAILQTKEELIYSLALSGNKYKVEEVEIIATEKVVANNNEVDSGSYGAGVCLVLFLNLVGLIVALCVGKEKTRTSAIVMALIEFFVAIILLLVFGL